MEIPYEAEISVDTENVSLWGKAIAIAAVVHNRDGDLIASFEGRYEVAPEDVDPWVVKNVFPVINSIPVIAEDYEGLLVIFFSWRNATIDSILGGRPRDKVAIHEMGHVPFPAEANLYADGHARGYFGDFEGPFPLYDPSNLPGIGLSVDDYNEAHGISPDPVRFKGVHNPLFDAEAAHRARRHWYINN